MDQVSKKSEKEKFRQAHNHAAMVETMMSARDMMRDPLPDNPPPDDKWKAVIGLARLNLNGACHRVMVCLIDHANPEHRPLLPLRGTHCRMDGKSNQGDRASDCHATEKEAAPRRVGAMPDWKAKPLLSQLDTAFCRLQRDQGVRKGS